MNTHSFETKRAVVLVLVLGTIIRVCRVRLVRALLTCLVVRHQQALLADYYAGAQSLPSRAAHAREAPGAPGTYWCWCCRCRWCYRCRWCWCWCWCCRWCWSRRWDVLVPAHSAPSKPVVAQRRAIRMCCEPAGLPAASHREIMLREFNSKRAHALRTRVWLLQSVRMGLLSYTTTRCAMPRVSCNPSCSCHMLRVWKRLPSVESAWTRWARGGLHPRFAALRPVLAVVADTASCTHVMNSEPGSHPR